MKERICVITPHVTAEVEVTPVAARVIEYRGGLYPVAVFRHMKDGKFLLVRKNGTDWVWIMTARNVNKFMTNVEELKVKSDYAFWSDVIRLLNDTKRVLNTS